MNSCEKSIENDFPAGLKAESIRTIQVNIGRLCNMACRHCHLEAAPDRTERMTWQTMEAVLRATDTLQPELVDITGGAPELHPDVMRFVSALSERGHRIQVRTNFTALLEPAAHGLLEFLAANRVALVGSLPCYLADNVDAQRGDGTYDACITVLKRLNAAGYGVDEHLPINLVYNPGGPCLPPPQAELESDYRQHLFDRFGIRFNHLFAITNMPLGRFAADLTTEGTLSDYNRLLRSAFNAEAVPAVMCRHQICIDWDGRLYDCDFNIAVKATVDDALPQSVDALTAHQFEERLIRTGEQCWGCVAGAGSSCAGTLS